MIKKLLEKGKSLTPSSTSKRAMVGWVKVGDGELSQHFDRLCLIYDNCTRIQGPFSYG